MTNYKKTQLPKKSNKNIPPMNSFIVPTTSHSHAIEENSLSELDSLKKEIQKLLVEKKQLLDTLDQLQLKSSIIADKKCRFLAEIEKNIVSERQNRKGNSRHMVFSIVTWGSSWTDGLVFTVVAESEVWAEELVRQWLHSNGRGNHRIDKVMGLVSQDVRAIVNVGAILLDV